MKKLLFLFLILQLLFSCGGDGIVKPVEEYPIEENLHPELVEKYKIRKTGLKLEAVFQSKDKRQIIFNGRIDKKLWVAVYDTETTQQLYEWSDKQQLEMRVNLKDAKGVSSEYELNAFQAQEFYVHNDEFYFILFGISPAEAKPDKKLVYTTFYIIKNNALVKKHLSYALASTTDPSGYEGVYYKKLKPWFNGMFVQYGKVFEETNDNYLLFSSAGEKLYSFDNVDNIIEQSEPIDMEEAIVLHSVRTGTINFYFSRFNLKTKESVWVSDKRPFKDVPISAKVVGSVVNKDGNIWSYATTFTTGDGSKIIKNIKLNIDTGELIL